VSVDALLGACKRVKKTGSSNWLACCPAHDDKNPSMTVRELPDGMVLVHCFAGCSVEEIATAAGIKLDELFPEKTCEYKQPQRRSFPAADVLAAVVREINVMSIVAADLAAGKPLDEESARRMRTARARLTEASRLAGID